MISITKNGVPLDKSLYTYDEETDTLSTNADDVVINTGSGCTIKAGDFCTIKARYNSTIKAGSGCTIDTGSGCTIKAGDYCTIKAMGYSTINAGNGCTIDAVGGCTIKAGKYSVIVRKSIFEVVVFEKDRQITICPQNIPGYVENGIYSVTGKPAIVAED